MRLTLVRSATVLLELQGRRILVDPMLDDEGARPPLEHTANPGSGIRPSRCRSRRRRSSATSTPSSSRTATGTISTQARIELLPREVPVFCQPEDEEALRELGFDARAVEDTLDWDGGRDRPDARPHRNGGEAAKALAPVSGFVLDDLYLAGDTVWYEEVEETIERHRPRVAVVNAGGAEFLEGGLIVMGADDVREVVARVPTVVAVHMEALNHCFLERATLAAAVPGVLVPEDGETRRGVATGRRVIRFTRAWRDTGRDSR